MVLLSPSLCARFLHALEGLVAALWKTEALVDADADLLANLCAAQAVLRKFVQAGPAIMDEWLTAKAERDEAREAMAEAPAREPSENAAKKARRCRARIHAPEILAVSLRATNMLVDLAHLIHQLKIRLIERGVDPRPYEADYAAAVVGRVFKDELKIDLEDLAHCSVDAMQDALNKVRDWMDQARKRIIPPASNPPPADAGPQEVKADPPPKPAQRPNDSTDFDVAAMLANAKQRFRESGQRS
jgi:hypothetical protein